MIPGNQQGNPAPGNQPAEHQQGCIQKYCPSFFQKGTTKDHKNAIQASAYTQILSQTVSLQTYSPETLISLTLVQTIIALYALIWADTRFYEKLFHGALGGLAAAETGIMSVCYFRNETCTNPENSKGDDNELCRVYSFLVLVYFAIISIAWLPNIAKSYGKKPQPIPSGQAGAIIEVPDEENPHHQVPM